MKIVKYSPEYKTQLIDFLQYLWEGFNSDARKKFFEWRYENNPCQKQPFIYVALDEEKIIGFRGAVPQCFTVNEKVINVFVGADGVVHPDYQRRGIFAKLNNALFEDASCMPAENSLILAVSANKLSTQGNLKQGFMQTNGLKNYCYKISIINLIKTKIFKLKKPYSKQLSYKNDVSIEINQQLPLQEIVEFLKKNRAKDKITNIRDLDYFKWRYSYEPEKIICVCCRKNSRLTGYMIIKRLSNMQSAILEYCSLDAKILNEMIEFAVKKLAISVLRTQVLTKQEKTFLFKSGLITEPNWLLRYLKKKERMPILVRPAQREPQEKDFFINGLDLRDIDNWQLYLADRH